MTQFVDFVALGWVEKSLREEMDAASKCLHLYQREPEELGHLRDAQRNIHSATGALRLCALDPAALLTEEIERVLAQLHRGVITGDARKLAMTELVAAIEALPAYLASVRAKREVTAGSIASVVNDLRHFGNRPALPESLFFNPPLPEGAGLSQGKSPIEEQHLKEFAGRAMQICHKYSRAALERDHQALKRLYALGKHAHPMLAGTSMEPYFRCYMGLIEVLAQSHSRPDEVIVDILKHCFSFLGSLSENGYVALETATPDPYIRKMLYYIGKTPTPTALQKSLREMFSIGDVDEHTDTGEGRLIQEDDLLDALGQTLEQLLEVMEFMMIRDLQVCAGNSTLVDSIVPKLKQIGVQLEVIGLSEQAELIKTQYNTLHGLSQQQEPASPADLVDFGGALISVKEALEYKLKNGLSAQGDGAAQDLDIAIAEQVVRCLGDMKDSINREFALQDLQKFVKEQLQSGGFSIGVLRPVIRAAKLAGEPELVKTVHEWEEESLPEQVELEDIANGLLEQLQQEGFIERAVTDLNQVLSVLSLLDDKQRECEVLGKCAHYVSYSVDKGGLVNDASMACFAEAIAALEQYMECRTEDPQGSSEGHLERAEARAAMLDVFLSQKGTRVNPAGNIVEFGSQNLEEKTASPREEQSKVADIVEFTSAGTEPEADEHAAPVMEESVDVVDATEAEEAPIEITAADEPPLADIDTETPVSEEQPTETGDIEFSLETADSTDVEPLVAEEVEADTVDPVIEDISMDVLVQEETDTGDALPLASRSMPWKEALEAWIAAEVTRGADAPLEDPEVCIDEELVECFVEESRKHIRKLEDAVPRFADELHNEKLIQEIRAIFHTMKGSARTIELNEFGEFMYSMEKVFNALRDGYIKGSVEIAELTAEVSAQMTPYVDLIMQRVPLYTRDFLIPAAIAEAMTEKRFSEDALLEVESRGEEICAVSIVVAEEVEAEAESEATAELVESDQDVELEFAEEDLELVAFDDSELLEENVVEENVVEEDLVEDLSPAAELQSDIQSGDFDFEPEEITPEFVEVLEEDPEEFVLGQAGELEDEQAEDPPTQEVAENIVETVDETRADTVEEPKVAAISYSAEIWEQQGAQEIMDSVAAMLMASGSGEKPAAGRMAENLLRSVVPALVELRDGEFLELSVNNLSYFLELPILQHLASDAVYGMVETEDGEQRRVPISNDATSLLRSYLELVDADAGQLRPAHDEAEALLRSTLDLPVSEDGSEASGPEAVEPVDATDAIDNVVAFKDSAHQEPTPVDYSVDDIDEELLELFIETLDEYTESIEDSMSALASGDATALRGLKNTLHTVKGAANSIGLMNFGALVHDFESQLGDLEHAGDICSATSVEAIDTLVEGLNDAAGFVRKRKEDWEPSSAVESDVEEVQEELQEEPEAARVETTGVSEPAEETQSARKAPTLRIETHRVDRLLDIGLEISMSNVRCRHALDAASQDRGEVQGLARRVLTLVDKLSLQLDTEIQARTEVMPEGGQFDPLEMDRMTEKQSLAAILREAAYDLQEEAGELGLHLDNAIRETLGASRLLQSNQSDLRLLRLVNFSKLGPGLRRLVHQVSRQLGKQVEFEFTCADGGLDISVFEQLKVALEHMLRNAIGHGIGTPDERISQGKAESGNIKLVIMRQGSEFVIRLLDDGNGMDPDVLRAKAVEQGLVAQGDSLTDDEALRLIFRAGFSTATQVTDVSGRGVGMDVVFQSVTQIGGTVEIQSKSGFYTQFDIRVPASIMVNGALLATVGEEQLAIPLTSLLGSDFRRRDDVHREASVKDGRITFRNEEFQLRYLGSVRGTVPVPSLDEMAEFVPVLFAQQGRRRVAFFVDALDNAEEMVIRSLGAQFTGVPGIAGGAVKSDGQPVLALDLNEFVGQVDHADSVNSVSKAVRDNATLILCVDDSVMMRRTYEKRLESLGYKVVTAVDGEDALDYLSQAKQLPDFIFTDLEMPNMNGFDFIANLRRQSRLENIPTVVVSSRDAEKHRAEAQRVGATDFMAKGANSADGMQAVIQRYLSAKALAS